MGEAGRPTDLTEELFARIRKSILDGNNLRETAKVCGIEENTLYRWSCDNYANLSDKIEGWKRDRKLILAEITSDVIQTLPVENEDGKVDKELLKIKQKEAEFIRETLGKDYYSKRSELTGRGGGAIETKHTITDDDFQKIVNIYGDNGGDKDSSGE